MQTGRLTGSAESLNVQYLRRTVLTYLEGENDWKWIVAVIGQSGLGKREVLSLLMPLKGRGWKFRSQALFAWLEQS
jgi:ABC-type phosphate transport system ATPase subunit